MKKQSLALLILSSSLLLSSCNTPSQENPSSAEETTSEQKESFALNKTSFSLAVGQSFQLVASVAGVSYSSSDASIATVDANGLVKGLSLGSAIISAEKDGAKALAKVSVTDEAISTLSISFASSSLALYEEESVSLLPTVKFGSLLIEDAEIEYGSSDESVVTYSGGKVKAIGKGTASIYAKVSYDGYSDIAYANVEVLALKASISPNFKTRKVVVGGEGIELDFTLTFADEEIKSAEPFAYSLSDESLAEIKDGKLLGKKRGEVSLTVSTVYEGESVSATIAFEVKEKIKISFHKEGELIKDFEILNGESLSLDIDDPVLEGYVFKSFVDEDGEEFDEARTYDYDTEFNASWYAVTGALDGAEGTVVRDFGSAKANEFQSSMNLVQGENFNNYEEGAAYDPDMWAGCVKLNFQVEGVNDYELTLPAFDFLSCGRVDWRFRDNYGVLDSMKFGEKSYAIVSQSFEASVIASGEKASLYLDGSYIMDLENEVARGEAGLSFTFVRDSSHLYQQFYIGAFTQYKYDYVKDLAKFIDSLPSDASTLTEDEAGKKMSEYSSIVGYLTPYEAAHYSEDAKIVSLKAALKGTSVNLFSLPEEYIWDTIHALGIYTDGKGFSGSAESNTLGINFQSGGVSDSITQYVEFPKVNYTLYGSVTFKMSHNYDGASVKVGEKTLTSSIAKDNLSEVKIETSNGKTTISYNGTALDLPSDVANGKKALRFDITRERDLNAAYDTFTITPFVATF